MCIMNTALDKLSMLYYFLQQNNIEENLFKNLLISEDQEFCKKHQNQYPVIFTGLTH